MTVSSALTQTNSNSNKNIQHNNYRWCCFFLSRCRAVFLILNLCSRFFIRNLIKIQRNRNQYTCTCTCSRTLPSKRSGGLAECVEWRRGNIDSNKIQLIQFKALLLIKELSAINENHMEVSWLRSQKLFTRFCQVLIRFEAAKYCRIWKPFAMFRLLQTEMVVAVSLAYKQNHFKQLKLPFWVHSTVRKNE